MPQVLAFLAVVGQIVLIIMKASAAPVFLHVSWWIILIPAMLIGAAYLLIILGVLFFVALFNSMW